MQPRHLFFSQFEIKDVHIAGDTLRIRKQKGIAVRLMEQIEIHIVQSPFLRGRLLLPVL